MTLDLLKNHEDQQPGSNGHGGYPDFENSENVNYRPKFEFPGKGDGSSGSDKGFSEFLHDMAQEMHTTRGIIMWGHIEKPKPKLVLQGLLRFSNIYLRAEAANWDGRMAKEERMANACMPRMAREATPAVPAEDLLQHWYSGAALEQIAKVMDIRWGLAYAEQQLALYDDEGFMEKSGRQRIREARARQKRAIFNASALPPAHSEFFWHWLRHSEIVLERRTAIGLGQPIYDFTEVRELQAKGEPMYKIADGLPWVMQEVYDRVVVSQSDGDRLRNWFGAMFIRQWPWDQQAPPELRKLALEERDDVDGSSGNRKSEDRKNEKKSKKGDK